MDELKPTKYGSIAYGVDETPQGNLLKIKDVIKALDYILDDDDLMMSIIFTLLHHLEQEDKNE